MTDTYEFLKAQKDAILAKRESEQFAWLDAATADIQHYRHRAEKAEAELATIRSAQPASESKQRKLIGWRTRDYMMETADPAVAKNWEVHNEMLPIFEGDANTKLQPASEPSPLALEVEFNRGYKEGVRDAYAKEPKAEPADAEFKNFHRMLCERFGYQHDPVDWKRDQVSLMEWIAKKAEPTQEPMFWVRLVGSDGGYEGPIHNGIMRQSAKESGAWSALYLHSAPQARKPLTDEQIDDIAGGRVDYFDRRVFARAIERRITGEAE